MSEQKYYVKLRPEIMYYSSYDGFESTIYTDFWLDKSGIFVPPIDRDKITKSELAEIMDGALYRKPFLGETGIQPEWINPLIELVPVEDDE